MKKAALHNLGCKVNAYETEAMRQLLEEAGYEIVPFDQKADVYVINTCTVTNVADRKSRQMLHRAKKLNPDGIVVAAGCYVQTSEETKKDGIPADILLGNNKKHELIGRLAEFEERRGKKEVLRDIVDIGGEASYEELNVKGNGEHTRAYLKVQDGCNQFCSYCMIPYARGRVRSRNAEDVLREARGLAQNGYKELVLTGIHLSSYGVDTGDSLLGLIHRLHEVEGIDRIRLGSLEPKIVTEEFAREISGLVKLCPHFHLSLQSGCDETLRRMNRRYSCEEYRRGCDRIRSRFEHPAITTDVIVGFPGETETEFETTRKFLREISFFEMHVFKYSKRKGTKAATMEDQVSEEVKRIRSGILLSDARRMSEEFVRWYEDRRVEVLLEESVEIDGARYMTGHTPEYVRAAVKTSENMANKLVNGRVECSFSEHILRLEEDSTENID